MECRSSAAVAPLCSAIETTTAASSKRASSVEPHFRPRMKTSRTASASSHPDAALLTAEAELEDFVG